MIELVKLSASFQKRNASNQLVDIQWTNGSATQTVFNGQGATAADAKAQIVAAFTPFAQAAQAAAGDASSALAALRW